MIDQLLQQSISVIKSGDKNTGRQLLGQILEQEPNNENAWLWMSQCLLDNDAKRRCFERVLTINPNNKHALEGLQRLEQKPLSKIAKLPKSNKERDNTLYSDINVTINNKTARFNSVSYAIANITSVRFVKITPDWVSTIMIWFLLAFTGLCGGVLVALLFNLLNLRGLECISVFLGLGAGLFLAYKKFIPKPNYAITLSTAAAEQQALVSESADYIRTIIKAVNQAIENQH